MGDTARPVEGRPDQEEQARLITRTGNGPTVDTEAELLEAEYGPADMSGVYQGPGKPAGDVDQDDAAEPAGAPGADETPADQEPAEGGQGSGA